MLYETRREADQSDWNQQRCCGGLRCTEAPAAVGRQEDVTLKVEEERIKAH
jgi:hypothetical protein